ncbi:MAG: phosphatase PAP2-related protein [Patescibacteria group bacterium]
MINVFREHIGFWTTQRKKSLYVGILFSIVALIVQYFAGSYSAKSATNIVGDLFLDNLPTVDLTRVVVDGAFLVTIFGTILLVLKPRYILFSLKVISLFIIIRSFFVTLTHLGIYPNQITLGDSIIDKIYLLLNMQDGFFFSGHTGLTFLLALIFWREKFWRYFFLTVSAIFGIAVLLAHVHYSIDVFAAPFITYAIFKLAELEFFKRDYAVLVEEA